MFVNKNDLDVPVTGVNRAIYTRNTKGKKHIAASSRSCVDYQLCGICKIGETRKIEQFHFIHQHKTEHAWIQKGLDGGAGNHKPCVFLLTGSPLEPWKRFLCCRPNVPQSFLGALFTGPVIPK